MLSHRSGEMTWLDWYNSLAKPSWTSVPGTIDPIWQILSPIILVSFVFVFVQAVRKKLTWLVAMMKPLTNGEDDIHGRVISRLLVLYTPQPAGICRSVPDLRCAGPSGANLRIAYPYDYGRISRWYGFFGEVEDVGVGGA